MSDVVIRCPNCGTTQGALGECDACHEAETRYYCPNHTPGRWLDGPACAACGARVTGRGDVAPTAVPPRASSRAPRPIAPPVRRGERSPPARPAPPPRRAPPEPEIVDAEWVDLREREWPPVRVRRPRGPAEPFRLPIRAARIVGSVLGCVTVVAAILVVAALLWYFGYCGGTVGLAAERPAGGVSPARMDGGVRSTSAQGAAIDRFGGSGSGPGAPISNST